MPDPDDTPIAPDVVIKARSVNFSELGSTGLKNTGGFIHEEFVRQLQGDKALRIFREMADNDPVVGAMLFAVDMLVRQVEWRVEPAEANSVEEILAQRQADRARTIQAAQMADMQRQTQTQTAMAASQGKKPDGTPLNPPPPGQAGAANPGQPKTPASAVKKAVDAFNLTPASADFFARMVEAADRELIVKAATANDPGQGSKNEAKGSAASTGKPNPFGPKPGAAAQTPPAPAVPEPGKPIDAPLDPSLQGDPMDLAQKEGEDVAVFVETCLHDMDMSWEDTLSTILSMLPFGWHTAEIVYKKRGGSTGKTGSNSRFDDGKIGWRYLPPRSQDTRSRWDIDTDDGSIKGMWQNDLYSTRGLVYLPIEKLLLFRTENRKGNPEGRSILRSAYVPWYYKKRIAEIEAVGIERDLAGLPVAYVPYEMLTESATQEEVNAREEIKKIVRNIKRDEQEGIIFPMAYDPESGNQLFKLELLSTGGTRAFDTDKILGRYDQRIVMCILADFILLGHENVGSKALSSNKIDLFTTAIGAWLDSIAEVFNTYAIPRLLAMNGMDPAASPKLVHGKLAQVDLLQLGTFILNISQAGAPLFPDDALETYLRDVGGLPTKEGGTEV